MENTANTIGINDAEFIENYKAWIPPSLFYFPVRDEKDYGNMISITQCPSTFIVSWNEIASLLSCEVIVKVQDKEEKVKAIFDTGAVQSFVSERLVTAMNIPALNNIGVSTAIGRMDSTVHLIDLNLCSMIIKDIPAIKTYIDKHGFDLAIGMDILSLGDFYVSNYGGKTKMIFRYPSSKNPLLEI